MISRDIYIPCIILAITGCLFSYASYNSIQKSNQEKLTLQLLDLGHIDAVIIENKFTQHLRDLEALKTIISVNGGVTRSKFYKISHFLTADQTAIQAMEWIPIVRDADRLNFEKFAREDGSSNFQIMERDANGKMIAASKREIYYPVFYASPLKQNQKAIGFDLGSNIVRKKALNKAAKENRNIVSAPIKLIQETENSKSILALSPVFDLENTSEEENLIGYALLVLRIESVIELFNTHLENRFSINLTDVTPGIPQQTLFTSPEKVSSLAVQRLEYSLKFWMADREWEIKLRPIKPFIKTLQTSSKYAPLTIGLSATALLTLMLWFFLTKRLNSKTLARHRLHSAELLALVDTAVDAIITIDIKGIVERLNPAAEKIFGYSKDEVIGKNIKILMPNSYAHQHDSFLSQYRATKTAKIIGIGRTVVGKRKDNSEFPMDLSVGELPAPIRGYVGIIRDVTEREKYEQQILQNTEELKRSNDDLAQFAYIASHDLKAPLRGIDNLAQWIEEKLHDHMDEECTSYMSLLRGRVKRLEALLSSLLEYSRIGHKSSVPESLDINTLIRNTIDLIKTDNFEIQVENFPPLIASKAEMNLLFQNLIGNAIKHHDQESGIIHITCEITSDRVEIAVHDDGPGIPEDMRDKVFTMFQTLQPRDQVEGSGMGLAFIKKIIDRHDASISISESKFDRGTAMLISWPLIKKEFS